ncbi:MAG: hypothetical protein ABIP61_02660 [Burkholderiaceae bacterium]
MISTPLRLARAWRRRAGGTSPRAVGDHAVVARANGASIAGVARVALAWTLARSRAAACLLAAAVAISVAAAPWFSGATQAQEALRPEIGKPLQAAQALVNAGKYREALVRVREADAVEPKSASESLVIERMRISAASGAGDLDTAARAFEAINASGQALNAEKLRMIESIAAGHYRSKQYASAVTWYQRYFKEGGSSAGNRTLLTQAQYLSGDYASVSSELMAEIQAAEKRGQPPLEDRINLLMNAAVRQKDRVAETFALERLVRHYPKKEYWVALLARLQRKPGFSDRLALDLYRLSLATGSMSAASDYAEMAQLALQAGVPAEARQVVDQGFASGVLGSGPQTERHQRLRALVLKQLAESQQSQAVNERRALAARDGNELLVVGMNVVYSGDPARGVRLLQQGLAKGGLKRPEDAKLHLAIAQLVAGQGAKAQATLKTVAGVDGTAELARFWALHARRTKTPA